MTDKARIDELRRGLVKKAIPFFNVFNSIDGQIVLDALEAEFSPTVLCDPIAHDTAIIVKAAQRDVVEYIKHMIKLREDNFDA